MSSLLAASISLPTEPAHKPLADKGLSQRYLRIQSRSKQREEHEGNLECSRKNVAHGERGCKKRE